MREVEAGAAFLDVRVPGWVKRINLNTLDLARGNFCILGQLEEETRPMLSINALGGAFGLAIRRMFGGDFNDPKIAKTVAALGFNGPYGNSARLTAAWKKLIRDRRRRSVLRRQKDSRRRV